MALRRVLAACLLVLGIIHLLPLTGAAGAERLQGLYGVAVTDPDLIVLMRHRAVLFGILGGYFVAAAFVPTLRLSALLMGLLSVASFLVLASGTTSPGIARIVAVDWLALAAVIVGLLAHAASRTPPPSRTPEIDE